MFIGKPSPPKELVGRKEEVNQIVSKMKSKLGYNLVLIGHRRIGKSSILAKVEDILNRDKKTVVVNFDVQYSMGEPKLFLKSLQRVIFEAYLKKLGAIQRIQAKTRYVEFIPRITSALSAKKITSVGVDMSIGTAGEVKILPKMEFADKEKDYRIMFEAVFATINAIADDSGLKFVIILDEFQDMNRLKRHKGLKNIMDLFRGVLQQRSKNVSYVVCGSHVHMLESLLQQGKSSLFQHFVHVPIEEMKKADAVKLFNKYIKGWKKKPSSALAEKAYRLVGGHPYYLMALAEESVPEKTIECAFEESVSSQTGVLGLYASYVLSESTSRSQGGPVLNSILVEMARSDAAMSSTEIGKKIHMPATSVVPYLNELIKADLVKKDGKAYFVRDRVVNEFLRRNF